MKISPFQICILGFPILLWSYFFVAPAPVSQKILIQKNIIGFKTSTESIFLNEPILSEKLTTFFETAPINFANALSKKAIVPEKFWKFSMNKFSVGILLNPLSDAEEIIMNQSSVSQNFDLLITSTSQIPARLMTNMPTVYANSRRPSDSFNKKFRLAKQALIWAESEILFDFSGAEMVVFK